LVDPAAPEAEEQKPLFELPDHLKGKLEVEMEPISDEELEEIYHDEL